ncbi:MAG TPA: Stk1 family PASTA domain-containing Ser/Thr kinase [Acidimicrobiales bacterium]|nr:Stk1 family PASTA domain-containing Ser/Thr kinase [Acidimicrobiales bacterium]
MDEIPETPGPRVFSGRYELNHLIARGGMAEVYRAHDRLLDRPVALKVLFPELSVDRSFVERFRREAQAAANLSHPNIVPVFDWGEDTGTYFIVMEFVDGRPLSSILKTAGPLAADRTAEIAAPVAAALGYAHKHGVVHRDVKPGNVLITDDGQVKVTDFGIARAVNTEESLTQTGAVMGTATYFSPEQAEGMGVDARTDIYSLGVVLFEMVTGRPPFLGDTPVAVASKHVRDHPPLPRELNPSIPPTFEAIILKAMDKNPDNRYATSEDLRADLLRFNEGRDVLAAHEDHTQSVAALGATGVMAGMAATTSVGAVGATQSVPAQSGEYVDEEPRRSRTRTYAIILAILLILLIVVGVLLARSLGYLGGGSSSFSMPYVVSQPAGQATATLRNEGLAVTIKPQPETTGANNVVLAQAPKRDTLVKKGDTVTLTVSQVTVVPTETVPSLAGQTQSQARTTLTQSHLTLGTVTSQYSTSFNAGQVISSDPASGTRAKQGSAVNIVVSQGTPPPTTTTTVPPTTTTTVPPTTTTTTSTTTTTTTAPPPTTLPTVP